MSRKHDKKQNKKYRGLENMRMVKRDIENKP